MTFNMVKQITSERIVLKHPVKPTFKLAEELYVLVEKSRNTLREWLPWVDATQAPEDMFANFLINYSQKNWDEKTAFPYLIYHKRTHRILGVIDLHHVDDKNKTAFIGYWLSDDATGHGYMQEAVKALEAEAFKRGLNRIIIKNKTDNIRSVHVAKRCGYHLDGVMRQDTWIASHKCFHNTNIFSKLKSEWEQEKHGQNHIKGNRKAAKI